MRDVEKLWKKMGISLRKSCGEKSGKVRISEFSTVCEKVFHNLSGAVGKFSKSFTHESTDVKNRFYTISTGLTNTTIILG